ncbi:MAG: N-acetylmuramoyl-L-alanine amidase [Elusimicrobiota bacterium]|jgi:N-acetylmuramoyl-L-alanine amidase
MRRLILSSSAVWLLFAASVAARGEEIQAVVDGRYREPITSYKVGGRTFINAKQAGDLYGGQVYWYPISGRVQMSFHGRRLQFLAGSGDVSVDGKVVTLEAPVMLRAAQAYVPMNFFMGDAFAALSGRDTQFNERSRLLTVERRSNVGSVRWFSYQDYTRIVVDLKRSSGYNAAARGVQDVEITVPFGIIDAAEKVTVDDGLVDSYALRQESKVARLSVRLAKPGLQWRVRELADPRRLALEVAAVALATVVPAGPASAAETSASPAWGGAQEVKPIADAAAAAGPEAGRSAPAAAPEPEVEEPAAPAAAPVPAPAAALTVTTVPAATLPRRRRIVIDPGHGGKDGGAASRSGNNEKDVNLSAARELARLLEDEKVFDVIMTRNDDTFIPLADRSRIANDIGADIFISMHCNASRNSKEGGFEVYFLSEKASDPEAERLAEFENSVLQLEGKSPQDEQAGQILRAMSKTENINSSSELAALVTRSLKKRVDLDNRGVKQAGFYVLRGTDAPAILVEMAFLTNRRDEAKLQTKRYRRRIVDGLYAGLLDYAKRQGWLHGDGRSGEAGR